MSRRRELETNRYTVSTPTVNDATSRQPLGLKGSMARVPPCWPQKLSQSARSRPDHETEEERCDGSDDSHQHKQCRGGRFNPDGSRSLSPPPSGPRAFSHRILRAPVPQQYRAATNITKYSEESNPSLWLGDYRLACHARGVDHDDFIIHNLPHT